MILLKKQSFLLLHSLIYVDLQIICLFMWSPHSLIHFPLVSTILPLLVNLLLSRSDSHQRFTHLPLLRRLGFSVGSWSMYAYYYLTGPSGRSSISVFLSKRHTIVGFAD